MQRLTRLDDGDGGVALGCFAVHTKVFIENSSGLPPSNNALARRANGLLVSFSNGTLRKRRSLRIGRFGFGIDTTVVQEMRLLVAVGVAVVVVRAGGFQFGWGGAAVGGFAAGGFELDGGVGDVELVAEGLIEAFEDATAVGHGHVADGDVAGEGVRAGAEGPDVEVVDVDDAGDGLHGFADGGELEVVGSAFEEDVEGFADDADGGVDDHSGDDEGEDRVYPGLVGEEDGGSACDDGGGGKGVAEHVEEDAADVDVAGEAPEEGGDGAIHEDAGEGDEHHKAGLDGDGMAETHEGFEGDPDGKDDEGGSIDEGGEDAGALVAEGLLVGCGSGLEVDGDEGEEDGKEV